MGCRLGSCAGDASDLRTVMIEHRVYTRMDEEDTGYYWECDCGLSGSCGVGTRDDAELHSDRHIVAEGGSRIDVYSAY